MLLLSNHYTPGIVQCTFQTGKPAISNVTLAGISRNYIFLTCSISCVCYGIKSIPTYMYSRTKPRCMLSLNICLRGFFLLVENECVVGEFFSLIRLASFVLLSPVAGAVFLIQ